jgi:hypothetical protein
MERFSTFLDVSRRFSSVAEVATTNSGRLVLRDQRHRSICLRNPQPNRNPGTREPGQKTCPTCRQYDCICATVCGSSTQRTSHNAKNVTAFLSRPGSSDEGSETARTRRRPRNENDSVIPDDSACPQNAEGHDDQPTDLVETVNAFAPQDS